MGRLIKEDLGWAFFDWAISTTFKALAAVVAAFLVVLSTFASGGTSIPIRFMHISVVYAILAIVFHRASYALWRQSIWLALPALIIEAWMGSFSLVRGQFRDSGLYFGGAVIPFVCSFLGAVVYRFFKARIRTKTESLEYILTGILTVGAVVVLLSLVDFVGMILSGVVVFEWARRIIQSRIEPASAQTQDQSV